VDSLISHRNPVGTEDGILESLERWKKRVIAAFLLLSLLVAVIAVLLFEAGGVFKVWQMEFGSARELGVALQLEAKYRGIGRGEGLKLLENENTFRSGISTIDEGRPYPPQLQNALELFAPEVLEAERQEEETSP
jgi:hypothetical protein